MRRALTGAAVTGMGLMLLIGCGPDTDGSRSPEASPPSTSATPPSASATDQGVEAEPLFGDPPAAADGQSPDTSFGAILRSRYVSFDGDVLARAATGTRVSMTFFDGATYVGTVAHIDRQDLLTSWSGPLDGLPKSLFVVTRAGDRYQLTASTTEGTYAMNLTGSGLYQVAQVDQPDVIDEPTGSGSTPPP